MGRVGGLFFYVLCDSQLKWNPNRSTVFKIILTKIAPFIIFSRSFFCEVLQLAAGS